MKEFSKEQTGSKRLSQGITMVAALEIRRRRRKKIKKHCFATDMIHILFYKGKKKHKRLNQLRLRLIAYAHQRKPDYHQHNIN